MSLQFQGSLPTPSIQIGIAATSPAIVAAAAALVDISPITAAAAAFALAGGQLIVDVSSLTVAVAALAAAAATINTQASVSLNATASASIAVRLGLVEAALAAAVALEAQLAAALAAEAGLHAWVYSGPASGFAQALQRDMVSDMRLQDRGLQTYGMLLMTESFQDWGKLSASIDLAPSTASAPKATSPVLMHKGIGGFANLGLAFALEELRGIVIQLQAMRVTLQAQLDAALGIVLPSIDATFLAQLTALVPSVAVQAVAALDLGVLTVLQAALQAKLDAFLAIVASLDAMLAAGSFAAWTWAGPADELPGQLAQGTPSGVPNGTGPDAACNACLVLTGLGAQANASAAAALSATLLFGT